jgi:hypothetical protein
VQPEFILIDYIIVVADELALDAQQQSLFVEQSSERTRVRRNQSLIHILSLAQKSTATKFR